MRIQEVEALVGISKKNIRFYESEGLISPGRNRENGYRDYSEADLLLLRKIRLLRRLGVPLEDIRRLQTGALTLEDAMERHCIVIRREKENLTLSEAMCEDLATSGLSYPTLEPEPFLLKMDELEEKGASFMDQKKIDVRKKLVGPIIAAITMILMMLGTIGILVWADTVDPIPLPIIAFFIFFPAAVCVGVLLALYGRIRELRSGEEEDADKY